MFLFLLVSVLINIILREGDVTYKRVIISTYCKLYLVYAYLSKQAHYANTDRVHTRGVQELDAIESSTIYTSHKLSVPDTELLGAGDAKLYIVGCVDKTSSHRHIHVKGKMYVVRGTPELLHGIPDIHSLGLILEFPKTYIIRA